jgi:hypothetical protein
VRLPIFALLTLLITQNAEAKQRLMYTTYFYTAAEAVIHGYENDTKVRIVSLEKNGTVFEGTVQRGESKLIPTGRGVFGFLTDKKASILVGTPSSCTAVGYFVRDREGSFRSKQFFSALPSSLSAPGARVVLWAWEDLKVTVTDLTADKAVVKTEIKAGRYHVIPYETLNTMGSHVLDFSADRPELMVQVYYDEGFFVPSRDGRAAGKIFYAYVGDITEGVNDLQLISYHSDTSAVVTDIDSGETLWRGTVKKGGIEAITLSKKFVRVTSDREIAVAVAPYKHYASGYAEHHFSFGAEGTGIENDFLITSQGELWIFSYYDGSAIEVTDAVNGKKIFTGTLGAGHARGLQPGGGFYRITSNRGLSVMSGFSACGGEYSPSAGLFAVDEALFEVVQEIKEERYRRAEADGRKLTEREASAPLTAEEMKQAQDAVKKKTGASNAPSPAEVQQRIDNMVVY